MPAPSEPRALASRGFRLRQWQVNPQLNRLSDGGKVIGLEPKLMELLCRLADAAGEVVTKDELVESVWGGQFIAESALTRAVSELRRALGDDAHHPIFIETIAKRGYRLLPRPEPLAADPEPVPAARGAGGRRSGWLLAALALLATTGLLAGWRMASHSNDRWPPPLHETEAGVRLAQITTDESLELHASYSPDGTHLAYCSSRSGRFEIYVRQLLPASDELQLTSDGGQNVQPAWSPDGRHVAYHSLANGGLWLIPALGGEARRLSEFGAHPSWSPDGKRLVFQSFSTGDFSLSSYPAMPPSTIYEVALDGREPRALTEPGRPPGGHAQPSLSAGGRILFSSWDLGIAGLWTIAADGTDLKPVTGAVGARDAVWARGQNAIYYTAKTLGDRFVWRKGVSPTTGETWGDPELLVRAEMRHLNVSPDGRRLLASRVAQRSHLHTVRLDPATGAVAGAPTPLTAGTQYRTSNPAFSPDGQRIVYRVSRLGHPDQLWLMDADGSRPRELTLDPEREAYVPSWSPNGRAVAFVTRRPGAAGAMLVSIDVASRDLMELFPVPSAWRSLELSPDGLTLAFYAPGPGRAPNVFTAELATGEPVQRTFEEHFGGFPVWSPDGQRLAVELYRDRGHQIGVVALANGETRPLTSEPGQSWPGGFSPNGQRVVFAAGRAGVWSLRSISIADGSEQRLTPDEDLAHYVRNPVWSPRGDQIVFERGEVAADLWEIELP